MPLRTSTQGVQTEMVEHTVDARWMMAYAASLNDLNPRFMDTTGSITSHPVFPVCLEWPAILATREATRRAGMSDTESTKGVHASHDLHIYRPIEPDERLRTQATIIDVQGIRPGAACTMRMDTWDEQNELVCQTYQTSIYRGVAVEADVPHGNCTSEPAPAIPEQTQNLAVDKALTLPIPGHLAHTYTECAHIYNPIHTDRQVALAAGLPDIILHGTATLALAVSAVVNEYLSGDAARVTRLGGRFAAIVLMPSQIELRVNNPVSGCIGYRVLNAEGQEALSQGFLVYQ